MKIIFSESLDAIAEHAREMVEKSRATNNTPRGIPYPSAKVPEVCDDCGMTFWHGPDMYSYYAHVGCKGSKQKDAGF